MKDFDVYIPFILSIVVAAILFSGISSILKKIATHNPTPSSEQSQDIQKEQERRLQEIEDRRRDMMERNQQRIRDARR